MTLRIDRIEPVGLWLAANLPVWLSVVFLYSQSIGLWRTMVSQFGSASASFVPIAVSALLLVLIAEWGRRHYTEISWGWVAASFTVFAIGLLMPDPAFPAKRIHVPEYFALTLLIYWSCRSHMPSTAAIWGSVVLAAGLGSVDELFQGAMASRTFGLYDIATNGAGAISAGLFLQALSRTAHKKCSHPTVVFHDTILMFGLGFLLVGANAHIGAGFPPWIYLPAVSALSLLALDRRMAETRLLDALGALCALALLLLGGIDALEIAFR